MIDYNDILNKYSKSEINDFANEYYTPSLISQISKKPFILPNFQHLLIEIAFLIDVIKLEKNDVVLDFGCGIGWLSRLINLMDCRVHGIDVSKNALLYAERLSKEWSLIESLQNNKGFSIDYKIFDVEQIPYPNDEFNKIISLDAFHHVPNNEQCYLNFIEF
jgi:cyclopropane fatty-acyl-phospholipid synthase-like methyltransferase